MSLFRGPVQVAGIPSGFTEHQFDTGEVSLNYVVGPDNGVPLLLIPGQMESWQGYKLVMPALAERFKVFVPDLRGHGRSSRTPGRYSYNICGEDLRRFMAGVIQEKALVAGLSSGGVLAIWLGAYDPDNVLAVVAEDPPIFSSIWPRITEEAFLSHSFQTAVDVLGETGERDVQAYLAEMGAPAEGKDELLKIPSFILKGMFFLNRMGKAIHPDKPYDTPLLPFNLRAGHKFMSEYDVDFSRATLDGRLSEGFDPEAALKAVKRPMLLLRVDATRHPKWGILGAIDDDDLARIKTLVSDLKVVEITGRHELHMTEPERYIDEVMSFVDGLEATSEVGRAELALGLQDIDGSCRDMTFEGSSWPGGQAFVTELVGACDGLQVEDGNGSTLPADPSEMLLRARSGSKHIHMVMKGGMGWVSDAQVFIDADGDRAFVEVTFFPDHLITTDTFPADVITWVEKTLALLDAKRCYVRYENASWQLRDRQRSSGVIQIATRAKGDETQWTRATTTPEAG